MVASISLILSLLLNIIICFGVPITALCYFIKKDKKCIKAFFIGALVFVVSQMILRIPLLNFLGNMNWYIEMTIFYPVLYILFLAFSAGVFEEIGRFLGFKIGLKNNRRWIDGVAFGIGHGGIEAIIFLGLSSLSTLFNVISLNLGKASSLNLEGLNQLYSLNLEVFMGGVERLFAISIHVGLSLIVLYGINKKEIRYLILAIITHGLVNFFGVFIGQLGANIFVVEGVIGLFSLMLFIFTIKSKKIFDKFEGVY